MARRLLGADLLDEAVAELEHEVAYYERHGGPRVRDSFLEAIAVVARRIAEHPRSFPEWRGKPGVRRVVLDRFPFVIGFVVGTTSAEPPLIVVIAHAKRRPGYWLARRRPRKATRRSGC
ncbi:MAG: type II toxin-antitoxin system RelE/ParE family toxin [Polyangiaceae bacterium]